MPVVASTADVVNRFFPASLASDTSGVVPSSERQSAFVTGDLNHDGSQLIAAAYCNGAAGAVAVISPAGDGTVVASAVPPGMRGSHAEIELVDIDGDARPEVVVTMRQSRGLPIAWIFKWSGSSLTFVGPRDEPQSAEFSSDLADPTFIALDGTIAVVDHHAGRWCDADGSPQASAEYRLLRWANGDLQLAAPLDFFAGFVRANGAPAAQTESFNIDDAAASRQMIVVNGDRNGNARVSSATITLNGQQVVGPSAFNQQTASVRVNVALVAGENRISVKLAGKPGGTVSILLLPRP